MCSVLGSRVGVCVGFRGLGFRGLGFKGLGVWVTPIMENQMEKIWKIKWRLGFDHSSCRMQGSRIRGSWVWDTAEVWD